MNKQQMVVSWWNDVAQLTNINVSVKISQTLIKCNSWEGRERERVSVKCTDFKYVLLYNTSD